MKSWYDNVGSYDLCGQEISTPFLSRFLMLVPTLSDNIMVDVTGHALLVDNVLDKNIRTDTPKGKYIDFLRRNFLFRFPIVLMDALIAMRRTYDRFSKNKHTEVSPLVDY